MAKVDEAVGLTKGEREVYLALAALGSSTANPIIKKTGMQKSTVYFCLDRLVSKGLISYIIRNNRRVFEAAPTDKLAEYIENRKKKLDEEKRKIEEAVKALTSSRSIEKHGARIFEGWGGFEIAFNDILGTVKAGEEICVFNVSGVPPAVHDRFRRFMKKFHKKLYAKKVNARLLMNERMRLTIGKDREGESGNKVRYISEAYTTPATINIYGNKVLLILLSEKPTVFMVEGKEIADSFRNYFELLWKEETRVYHGLEGIKALLEEILTYDEAMFIGGRGQVPIRLPDYFWNEFVPRAEKKGHKWRLLGVPEIVKTPAVKINFLEIKFLPESTLGPIVIWIFGNKVVNVVWREEPIAFAIENKETTEGYKDYFEMLWRDEVRVYRGLEGIKLLLEKALEHDQIRIFGGRGQVSLRMSDYLWNEFAPRAEKKGFRWRILGLPEIVKTPIMKAKFVEVRLLPHLAIGPTITHISGDRVVNVIWSDNPTAFEIKSKDLAKSFGEYFEMLWKSAKGVKR